MSRFCEAAFVFVVLLQFGVVGSVCAAPGPCTTIKTDDVYWCPTEAGISDEEFLYVKGERGEHGALYAGKLRQKVLTQTFLFQAPDGWDLRQHSISPNRKIIVVTMSRPDCRHDWPSSEGASCSWGRSVLFAAVLRKSATFGNYFELVNLASQYGKNSQIFGWQTWLTVGKVLFNAKIVPDDVDIDKNDYCGAHNDCGFAYTLTFDYDEAKVNKVILSLWSGGVNSDSCFIGRIHASAPTFGYTDTCGPGQYVTFTRRCYDEPLSSANFAWWNSINDDGTGGKCIATLGSPRMISVFKVYTVPVDQGCEPASFNRNLPIRTPDWTGRYRHMGFGPEWGDGQPTISLDGELVAFWSNKSSELADKYGNCAGFETQNNDEIGNGAFRVSLCFLDRNRKYCTSRGILPQPANPWDFQSNPYFYRQDNGNLALFTSETSGIYLTDLVTGQRTRLVSGHGGYPITP
jgi:hypothetical protein